MSIILISFVLVMKFTNSFLVSCRSISYNTSLVVYRSMTHVLLITRVLSHWVTSIIYNKYVVTSFSRVTALLLIVCQNNLTGALRDDDLNF